MSLLTRSLAPLAATSSCVPSRPSLRHVLAKRMQRLFWIYWVDVFEITSPKDFAVTDPAVPCSFVPITSTNCSRVLEFRDQSRLKEYRNKLARGEIGSFVETGNRMVAGIWATMNSASAPICVRSYMPLAHSEALIHDIVTGDDLRGMGIGPFMVAKMALVLLGEYNVSKIIIDVSVRNRASLRMMCKAGLTPKRQMLYVSAFGRLTFRRIIKQF